MFSIVLRHSNYNNRIISIEGTFLGHPVERSTFSPQDSGLGDWPFVFGLRVLCQILLKDIGNKKLVCLIQKNS